MNYSLASFLTIGALVVGCGDSGGSATGGTAGGEGGSENGGAGAIGGAGGATAEPVTVAEFLHAKDVAYCEWSFGCCQVPPPGDELTTTVEHCENYEVTGSNYPNAKVETQVNSGLVLFDPDAAAQCMAFMANLDCSANFWSAWVESACDQVFQSQSVAGELCTYAGCAPGAQCILVGSGQAVCWPTVPLGANCQGDVLCEVGTRCDYNYTWICEAALPNGATCSLDDECDSLNCEGTCVPQPVCW